MPKPNRRREAHVRQRIVERFDGRISYEDIQDRLDTGQFNYTRRLTGTRSMAHMLINCMDVFVVVTRADLEIHTVLTNHEHADYTASHDLK